MLKSEYAQLNVTQELQQAAGPVLIGEGLIKKAGWLTDDGDPRWIGVALSRMEGRGEIFYPVCDGGHSHDDTCTVQLVTPA